MDANVVRIAVKIRIKGIQKLTQPKLKSSYRIENYYGNAQKIEFNTVIN